MYNTDMPNRAALPTSRQLLRSTLIAAVTALILLVTVVLPAEYGIDPTGVGRALGLAEMGEIKTQLAEEAEADRLRDQVPTAPPEGQAVPRSLPDQRSGLVGAILARLLVSPAAAQATGAGAARLDEITVTLEPGQGAEVKVGMRKGARTTYAWTVEGGIVNHDTHGEPFGKPDDTHSYAKGRGVGGDEGVLTAAFDGNHGWFWRNRGDRPVTVRLTTSGDYESFRRIL
jgi:hypothetical protein